MPSTRLNFIFILLVTLCTSDKRVTRLAIKSTYEDGSPVYISTEISTFVGLAYDSVMFVDKSLLIKEIMEDDGKIFLITCPRGWGKSVNLNMLKVFFELRVNYRSQILRTNKTFNYLLFVKGEVWETEREKLYLKSPLFIAQYPLFIERYLGQYPVIYVEFDYQGLENTFQSLVEGMRICMSNAYADHKYLIATYGQDIKFNETITEEQKEIKRLRFNRIYDFLYYGDSLTPFDILSGIQSLSELLHHFFRRKVIILIDEYHSFWEKILTVQWPIEDEKTAFLKFYINFMERTFTNNTFYQKAVITGVHPPPQEGYNAFFNNTIECNLLTGKLMQFYGFNKSVMDDFYETLHIPKNTRNKADRWYGGNKLPYNLQLYNPVSVADFLSEDEFDKYWMKDDDISTFTRNSLKSDRFRYEFHNLVDGKETQVEIHPYHLPWKDFETIYKIFRSNDKDVDYDGSTSFRLITMFLHHQGYLILGANIRDSINIYFLRFPNEEIRLTMKLYLENFYERMFGLNHMHPSIANDMKKEFDKFIRFPEEESAGFRKALENYLHQNRSIIRSLEHGDQENNRLILFEFVSYLLIDKDCDHKEKFDHTRHTYFSYPMAVVQFGGYATIIDIKFNQPNAEVVLNLAKSHRYNPVHPLEVNVTKFIGINLRVNSTVEAACEYKLKDEIYANHRIS